MMSLDQALRVALGLSLAAAIVGCRPAAGAIVYSNGFETAAGPEWSAQPRSISPAGARRYLGPFGNQTVALTLNNLPAHTGLRVSFDVYVILYWTGNGTYYGPHLWDFGLTGSPPILHTTFSNGDQPQAYPGNYPEVNNPPYTGATEVNTLGFTPNLPGDSVYRMSFDVYHTAGSVSFQFAGSHLEGLPTTNWGLDNVTVETVGLAKPPASGGNLVVNGDFETPIVDKHSLATYNAPSLGIPGWTLSDGSIDLTGEYWENAGGRQSLDMNGLDYPGTIYQDVPTKPGKSYIVSFNLAGNNGGAPVKRLEAWWGDRRIDSASFDAAGTTYEHMGWVRKQYLVTTPVNAATFTRLKFISDNTGSFGPALDLVSVVPAAPGDLVLDGEFEEPNVGAGRADYATFDSFGGWTVIDGTAQQAADWQAAGASQSIHLNGEGSGSISASAGIATAPGQAYVLRFAMAGDPDGGPAVKTMQVNWGSTTLEPQTFDTTGHTRAAMGWSRRAYLVAAAGTSTDLRFASLTPGTHGPALDSVSVVPATPGDANLDGAVTVADALRAVRLLASADADPVAAALSDVVPVAGAAGRLHGDGALTMADVRAILQMASGLAPAG